MVDAHGDGRVSVCVRRGAKNCVFDSLILGKCTRMHTRRACERAVLYGQLDVTFPYLEQREKTLRYCTV